MEPSRSAPPGPPPTNGKTCPECGKFKPASEFHTRPPDKAGRVYLASSCKCCAAISTRRYRNASPEARLLHSAKSRAKQLGLPFDLDISDCAVPDVCPVLGIPLRRDYAARVDATPSIDRIDPARGYVRGNVAIVSWRANRLKNNATAQELAQLARFYYGRGSIDAPS